MSIWRSIDADPAPEGTQADLWLVNTAPGKPWDGGGNRVADCTLQDGVWVHEEYNTGGIPVLGDIWGHDLSHLYKITHWMVVAPPEV